MNVQVVQPYNSTDTDYAWKNSRFILSKIFISHMFYKAVDGNPCFSYAYVGITFSRCDIATEICELLFVMLDVSLTNSSGKIFQYDIHFPLLFDSISSKNTDENNGISTFLKVFT